MCKNRYLRSFCEKMIDIRDYPEIIDCLNSIINNKGTAEIKNEARKDDVNLVVVEISRSVKTKKSK